MRKYNRDFLVYELTNEEELWVSAPMFLADTIFFITKKGSDERMKTIDYPLEATNAILAINHGMKLDLKFSRYATIKIEPQ